MTDLPVEDDDPVDVPLHIEEAYVPQVLRRLTALLYAGFAAVVCGGSRHNAF
jgi:hypothetical protein